MEHIGDPHQEILQDCRTRGWIDLIISKWDSKIISRHDDRISHPKGFFQPGVLVVNKNGTVLYRWQSGLTKQNYGGSTHRPTPEYVWSQIHAALNSPQQRDAAVDNHPETDDQTAFWPFFVVLLLAKGWFIRPKIFASPDHIRTQMAGAIARIPLFLGLWGVAFYYLALWVTIALLIGWIALIVPGIRRINRNFLKSH